MKLDPIKPHFQHSA